MAPDESITSLLRNITADTSPIDEFPTSRLATVEKKCGHGIIFSHLHEIVAPDESITLLVRNITADTSPIHELPTIRIATLKKIADWK